MQVRIETILKAQARIRALYHRGAIDDAIREYDAVIGPALSAVDHRIGRLARRISLSFIQMVNDDLKSGTYQ